jgi:hypothetical protein
MQERSVLRIDPALVQAMNAANKKSADWLAHRPPRGAVGYLGERSGEINRNRLYLRSQGNKFYEAARRLRNREKPIQGRKGLMDAFFDFFDTLDPAGRLDYPKPTDAIFT